MKEKRATYLALLGIPALLWGANVHAQEQPWLRDQRFTDGKGIRTGNFILHPGAAVELGYDSNPQLRSGTALEPKNQALRLMVTPHVQLTNRLPPADGSAAVATPAYTLDASAAVTYSRYIPIGTRYGSGVSFGALGLLGGLRLNVAPGGKWGAALEAGIIRSIQPSSLADTSATFNRTTPTGSAAVIWRPGGGLFEWRVLGYGIAYTWFESNAFSSISSIQHQVFTRGQWRFRPRTSLLFDSTATFLRYSSGDSERSLSNGEYVTSRVGATGLLTNAIGFTVFGGWQSTFFRSVGPTPVRSYDGFVGQAEVRFYPGSSTTTGGADGTAKSSTVIALGYTHDFVQGYITNYYYRDRGYAAFTYFITTSLIGSVGGGVARLSFPESYFSNGVQRNDSFTGTSYDATAFLEYRPLPSLGINLTGTYQKLDTGTFLRGDQNAPPGDPSTTDEFKWDRFQAFLGVRYLL